MLPEEASQEFKALFIKLYKVELTDDEAREKTQNLVCLYEAILNGEKTDTKQNEITRTKI